MGSRFHADGIVQLAPRRPPRRRAPGAVRKTRTAVRKTRAAKPRKLPRVYAVRLNAYEIVSRCVETGIERGFNRAQKHDAKPARDTICEHIFRETMNELCEVLAFEASVT